MRHFSKVQVLTFWMSKFNEIEIAPHRDAVAAHHRFPSVTFRGVPWDLTHLEPFAFSADVGREDTPLRVDVVVLFMCHCFTKGVDGLQAAPLASDYYDDGREVRVLCEERYALSRRFLPGLVKELFGRTIRVASDRPNYLTLEVLEGLQRALYAVFFEVEKDKSRRKRMLLRVQSAYKLDALPRRLEKAGKVNFAVLLRATYEGRKIKA
jgi:hypothetical protein